MTSVGTNSVMDRDVLKILGLDGLERHEDPEDAWPPDLKHDFLEVRGLGEVEWGFGDRGCD